MATRTVTSQADATSQGWTFLGSGSNWYAELPVQCGGRAVACAATSAQLITAIQQVEIQHGHQGGHTSPQDPAWPGHI